MCVCVHIHMYVSTKHGGLDVSPVLGQVTCLCVCVCMCVCVHIHMYVSTEHGGLDVSLICICMNM